MLLGGSGLVFVAIVLAIIAWAVNPKPWGSRVENTGDKLRQSLARGLYTLALCAGIAVLIIWALPTFKGTTLDQDTLNALNARIAELKGLLEYSWMFLVALGVSLGVGGWLGWVTLTDARRQRFARVLKYTTATKFGVAVLASCAFVGIGMERRISDSLKEAVEARFSLAEAQLDVFEKATRLGAQDLVSSMLDQLRQQSPAFHVNYAAYTIVQPFLPFEDNEAVDARFPADFQYVGTLSKRDAEALSAVIVDGARTEHENDTLTRELVDLIFDEKAAEPIKAHLLGIHNPVLSELVRAITDPTIAGSIKHTIAQGASAFLSRIGTADEFRARLRDAGRAIALKVSALRPETWNAGATGTPATQSGGEHLGEPRWAEVRIKLEEVVIIGLKKDEPTKERARVAMQQFGRVWSAADDLIQGDLERRVLAERLFARYLLSDSTLSALWGYGVISFVPDSEKSVLVQVSTKRYLSTPEGLGDVMKVRRVVRFYKTHPQALVKADPKVRAFFVPLVSLDAPGLTDERIASGLSTWHGPKPIDGYNLYFTETKGAPLTQAMKYFTSSEVNDAVWRFCPHTAETAAPGRQAQ